MKQVEPSLAIDPLTGLHSRWYMLQKIQEVISAGQNRVFVDIDVDGFHRVNDEFGSETGDELLRAIGDLLRKAYPDAIICRVAVDEFAFLLPPTNYSRYQMSRMTHNFFRLLHAIDVPKASHRLYTFSLGSVFIDPKHHTTPDSVFTEALLHRREAKRHEGTYLYSFYGCIPDIEGSFLILRQDRQLYNEINNRLFAIRDRSDWMAYLREGAELKGNMYRRNQSQLDDILAYFSPGDLPDLEYEQLFQQIVQYAKSLDAFMFEMLIANILLPHYERSDRNSVTVRSRLGHLYLLMADSLFSVLRMGDDTQRDRIKDYLRKCMDVTRGLPHDSIAFGPYYFALCHLLGNFESLELFLADASECDRYYEELRQLTLGPDAVTLPDPEVVRFFEYLVNNARLFPIYRACHLRMRLHVLSEAERNEYHRRLDYIQAHLVDGVYDMAGDSPEQRRMAQFLQGILFDDLSVDEILDRLIKALGTIRTLEYGKISQANIVVVAYIFVGAARALEHSKRSPAERRAIGLRGVSFLVELLRQRESIASDPQLLFLIRTLMRAMLRSTVITAADKLHYLEQAMAAVMLDTYCHSRAVAAYAKLILTNIIDNHPGLLVGAGRPYRSREHLEVNRKSLLEFMDCACLLHDVGKMQLTPITSNAYRKLSGQEFALLQRHPEFGAEILGLEPAFAPFLPFALCHHRWWNGENGYPRLEADAERSDVQVLIDILSISDSLEAATCHIGRNYRQPKTFFQVLDEFYCENGTRYSSEVLQTIIGTPDTYYRLRQMVDVHWQNVYLSIYQHVVSQPVVSDVELNVEPVPDLYRYLPAEGFGTMAESSEVNLPLPEWLRQMNREQLLLLACTLLDRNRLEVQQNGVVVFFYEVASDRVSILSRDDEGRVAHTFANHYSDNRLGILVSQSGYQRIMDVLHRIVTDPSYPREGQFKVEYQDLSRNLLLSYTSILDTRGRVVSISGHLEDLNTTPQRLLQTIQLQNRHLEMFDSLVSRYLTVVFTDVHLGQYELVQAPAALRSPISMCADSRQIIHFVCQRLIDPEQREAFMEFCDASNLDTRLHDKPCITMEFHTNLSGWIHAHILPVSYDDLHHITHLLFVTESVESEHKQLDFLARAAHFDSLTGLFTRSHGEELITQHIAEGGAQILGILDCDNFKRINDELSHLVGDSVLRELELPSAEVFADHVCMRLGGDEFVVHIYGEAASNLINAFGGVRSMFQQLAERVSKIRLRELEYIPPTISCGVVYSDGSVPEHSFETFYRHADEALHRSKRYRNGTITTDELSYRDYFH